MGETPLLEWLKRAKSRRLPTPHGRIGRPARWGMHWYCTRKLGRLLSNFHARISNRPIPVVREVVNAYNVQLGEYRRLARLAAGLVVSQFTRISEKRHGRTAERLKCSV